MSDSAESLAGEAGQPLDQLGEDIRAEIADHLALSAAEAARRTGCTGEAARQAALKHFGNVTLVHWKCWWVQQGDFIMRRAGIIIAVVLVVGLLIAGVALPTLASLRSMRDNVDKLTEQLTALTKAQQELVEKQAAAQAPVELRGKCYLKTEDQPAVGADIEIWNVDEMKRVDRVWTDDKGAFHSGPLRPGTYFAMAALVGKENPNVTWKVADSETGFRSPAYAMQSKLQYVSPGLTPEPIAFNLYFAKGDLGFELAEPMPATMKLGNDQTEFAVRADVGARRDFFQRLPWMPLWSQSEVKTWPLLGVRGAPATALTIIGESLGKSEAFWIAGQDDSERGIAGPQKLLLARQYECAALFSAVPLQKPGERVWSPGNSEYSKRQFENLFQQSRDGVYWLRVHNWSSGYDANIPLKILPVELRDGTLQIVRIKNPSSDELNKLANEQPTGFTLALELELGSSEPLRN